jgi:phosphoribosylaminoimidazole (AIR) synthetase
MIERVITAFLSTPRWIPAWVGCCAAGLAFGLLLALVDLLEIQRKDKKMKPILSVRKDSRNDRHTVLSVFNRGAHCGTLTVLTEDADEIVRRLYGGTLIKQSVGTIEQGAKVTGVKIDRLG